MNERIYTLAEQADKWASEEYHRLFLENINPDKQELFNKKFAELIVKECITVIENEMPEFNCKEEFDNLINMPPEARAAFDKIDAQEAIKKQGSQAEAWARAHPDDPRAKDILKRLGKQ